MNINHSNITNHFSVQSEWSKHQKLAIKELKQGLSSYCDIGLYNLKIQMATLEKLQVIHLKYTFSWEEFSLHRLLLINYHMMELMAMQVYRISLIIVLEHEEISIQCCASCLTQHQTIQLCCRTQNVRDFSVIN